MIFKRLCILITACLAGNAYALPPTDPVSMEIFMAGASAQDNNIEALFKQLCLTGTLDIFRDIDNPASPGRKHRAFFCRVDSSKVPGLQFANPNVLFHKRSDGGSAQGVNPLISLQPISHMNIKNGNCKRVGTTTEWTCTINKAGDLVARLSDAGVSDVNPEMFVGVNTPPGFAPVNVSAVVNTMDVTPAAALVFGIPVTVELRDALQEVQINAGRLAGNCIGNDTAPCMPILNKHQVASLMSGQIQHWNQLTALNSAIPKQLKPFAQAVSTVAPPANTRVAICRRIRGSGTQATTNAVFLNNPCNGFAYPPARTTTDPNPGIPSNPLTGPIVIDNSGSGDVELCLDDFNNGTNVSGANPSLKKFWAIGVQSTENNSTLAHDYRFVKIDWYAPTLLNAANGNYLDWVEITYQWKKQGQPNAPGPNKLALLKRIALSAGGPAILGPLNLSKYVHPWGVAGYLALSVNGHRLGLNGAFNVNLPVTPYTHRPVGLPALNNCRVPVLDRFAKDVLGNHLLPL